jgi:[ribosomal protein S5]-alanine N-acetyltransferase
MPNTERKHELLPFTSMPELSNDWLVLRELRLDEAASILDICRFEGAIATNEAEAVQILEKIRDLVAKGESLHWGIYIKETNAIAGTCGFYRGFAGKRGEIGYVLKPAYRGRGIATQAARLMVAFGFETLKLDTVMAYTDPDNFASQAVLKRAGFTRVKSDGTDTKYEVRRP